MLQKWLNTAKMRAGGDTSEAISAQGSLEHQPSHTQQEGDFFQSKYKRVCSLVANNAKASNEGHFCCSHEGEIATLVLDKVSTFHAAGIPGIKQNMPD